MLMGSILDGRSKMAPIWMLSAHAADFQGEIFGVLSSLQVLLPQ